MKLIKYPSKEQWTELLKRPALNTENLFDTVRSIINKVRAEGDKAVLKYEATFDKVTLSALAVTPEEIQVAGTLVSDELKAAISLAKQNIETFHASQRFIGKKVETMNGVTCWQKSVGIEKVGLYIPGGTAPLFSTVLMLAVPAKIAGCKEIVLCTPPDKNGNIHPAILFAAQAGVRYSISNPDAYIESNLIGFYNILEACRHSYDDGNKGVEHLIYASSSSVYGSNKKVPYSTDDKVDNPVSLYAATKKSNELMAHAYSKLYNIPSTGLRFFTVYGPAGRPDMAYFGFTNKLVNGDTIKIFNYGNCKRDFTYVDDIVEGVIRIMNKAPEKKNGEDGLPIPPYAIYNIGNSNPENLLDFVQILSEELVRAGVLPEDYDFEDCSLHISM